MLTLVDIVLTIWAFALAVPVVFVFLACMASLLPPRRSRRPLAVERPTVAVLIPAHDEEAVISATLASVLAQVGPGDRVIVVADNCTDDTARVARQQGATVLERVDANRRGKGYALDHGLRYLESDPPDVVVMIDADCHVHEGAIDELAMQAAMTARPVQAAYLLYPPNRAGMRDLLSSLAFTVKGVARAGGLDRLGLPCLLGGTGMAFPWTQIQQAPVASANIVEDMQLGLDLAIAGHPPCYCSAARVTGRLPQARDASLSQRTRWEHGHLRTILRQCPRLVWAAFREGRWKLLALALELAVPPLSLLVLMLACSTVLFAVASLWNVSHWPLVLSAAAWLLLLVAILACRWRFARDFIPLSALLAAPLYALAKVPIYLRFAVKPERSWVRTRRDAGGRAPEAGPGGDAGGLV